MTRVIELKRTHTNVAVPQLNLAQVARADAPILRTRKGCRQSRPSASSLFTGKLTSKAQENLQMVARVLRHKPPASNRGNCSGLRTRPGCSNSSLVPHSQQRRGKHNPRGVPMNRILPRMPRNKKIRQSVVANKTVQNVTATFPPAGNTGCKSTVTQQGSGKENLIRNPARVQLSDADYDDL